jgi:hypothetical protein
MFRRQKPMSHLNSMRLPATVIFTALLILIMLSASNTTYRLAPPADTTVPGYALAACDTRVAPKPVEPARACPWPHRKGGAGFSANAAPADAPGAE